MASIETPTVRPGQVWADNDPRMQGRTIEILSITQDRVMVKTLTTARNSVNAKVGATRPIRLDRLRPTSTGYRLVSEAPEAGA